MSRLVKSVVLVGMFALASNVWAAPPGKLAPPSTDVKMKSSRLVPVTEDSLAIEVALAGGELWARDPLTVALRVARLWPDTSGERSVLRAAVDHDGTEMPRTRVVTLVLSDLMDDSIGAEWHQVRIERAGEGWRPVEHRVAQRCQRGRTGAEFVAEPCP